jgi:hypothetical protein
MLVFLGWYPSVQRKMGFWKLLKVSLGKETCSRALRILAELKTVRGAIV